MCSATSKAQFIHLQREVTTAAQMLKIPLLNIPNFYSGPRHGSIAFLFQFTEKEGQARRI